MFCSGCGKQLREDENFCSGCGKSIVRENNSQESFQSNVIQGNNNVQNSVVQESNIEIPKKETSPLKKAYFKWLIIITLVFGLLEVLLVFLMPFGEIHLKVLGTIGLIVLFGLIGLLLIGLYESTDENKFTLVGIGVNVGCFVLSALLVWEIFTDEFFLKTMGSLATLLVGLIIISALFMIFSTNKYILLSRKITNGAILSAIALFSLGIYNLDLFDVDIFVRAIWAICILIVLGLFVTLLLAKMYPDSNVKVKKKPKVWVIVVLVVFFAPSLVAGGYSLISHQIYQNESISMPYAKVSIPANTLITEDMIDSKDVIRKELDDNWEIIKYSNSVVGMYTKKAINKGDYFHYSELAYEYEYNDRNNNYNNSHNINIQDN